MLARLLTALLRRLALHGEHSVAQPKRLLLLCSPRRPAGHHRPKTDLDLEEGWPWTPAILAAGHRLDHLAA